MNFISDLGESAGFPADIAGVLGVTLTYSEFE